jgi:hypothetical protein
MPSLTRRTGRVTYREWQQPDEKFSAIFAGTRQE